MSGQSERKHGVNLPAQGESPPGGAESETAGQVTGGCLCGAVRYVFSGKLWPAGVCHCQVCCKLSGGAGGAWFGVPREKCQVSGDIGVYECTADSGNVIGRGSCAVCRAPVYNTNSMMPDMLFFAAGSLDKMDLFVPQVRLYTAKAPCWSAPEDGIPRYAGMLPTGSEKGD